MDNKNQETTVINNKSDETTTASSSSSSSTIQQVNDANNNKSNNNAMNNIIKSLASLSLQDYKWRSDYFKKLSAQRSEEEILARMVGDTPSYVRPMDAGEGRRGPLGDAEESAVRWLRRVFDGEAQRAQKIAEGDGNVVRPMQQLEVDGNPLSELEMRAVMFFRSITDSETARVLSGKIRPMDMEESKRGPLGQAEAKAVSKIKEIADSEKLRAEQSKIRGGAVVRPIDIPGPLGEFEKKILDIVTAEKQRAKDRETNAGKMVRPKDSRITGPFGQAEMKAVSSLDRVRKEEEERLRNIRKAMEENRPMEKSRDSPLGLLESIFVGILRAPQMIQKVWDRVQELMQSEMLLSQSKEDADVV
eukprot:CAMPEP_0196809912 /NCGR_PEP_ID=MMETSP1362-20130617/9793_1 /TAXON_ID=163516 /ORGANISM="Leptocylindrus danicus, Strain CCMP1856" /LENGTH=360 /DNA_ID=CAMNT_0042184753 /DNA_START=80 /DNA_END=1158 /DNA_ORIENTATION=-